MTRTSSVKSNVDDLELYIDLSLHTIAFVLRIPGLQ